MVKICMLTYLRENEIFTDDLRRIADTIYNISHDSFKVLVCCSKKPNYFVTTKYSVEFVCYGGTKYHRLIHVLDNDDSEYYVSVDNDIKGNLINITKLIKDLIDHDYDIGWGKIQAVDVGGVIPELVTIDKIISHDYIRPLLWNLNIGVSIPGQFFCIKSKSYRGKLLELDTFLDDLAIGVYSSNNQKSAIMSKEIMGYELPNTTFWGLWNQRSRWAKGYATIINGVKDSKSALKVIVHGFAYHGMWLLQWLAIYVLYHINILIAFLYLCVSSYMICGRKLTKIVYAVIYQFLFPIFHFRWLFQLFVELYKLR